MHRFFVNLDNIDESTIEFGAEVVSHIRSLRLRPDEQFIISDGNCNDYICKLVPNSGDDKSVAEIIAKQKCHSEPSIKCINYIAYSKGDRLDYAVQKSVELGVHEIVLFESARCVAVPNNIPKKIERLQRISFETAKQSGRGIIPKISAIGNFKSAIKAVKESSALPLFFYESEEDINLMTVLNQESNIANVAIITGPEGGFEPHEVEYANESGIHPISLGPRILRCETAPIVALSAVMYHTGNL